jgi:hypothetical protein
MELDTLADAANYILAQPERYQDRNAWRRATELLMQAAEQEGDIEAATEQFERALFLEGEVSIGTEKWCGAWRL